MATTVTMDPQTGSMVHMQEHRFLVNLVDDAAYYGLMVYVFDYTGLNRLFLPLPDFLMDFGEWSQALRYGMLFATMAELRRWLEAWGIKTELFSYWLDSFVRRVV